MLVEGGRGKGESDSVLGKRKDYIILFLLSGFAFAGSQFSVQCFCDNDYGRYGRVDNSECDMPCGGDVNEKCGDVWKNSIYATGVPPPDDVAGEEQSCDRPIN